jgi:hypothetical protein
MKPTRRACALSWSKPVHDDPRHGNAMGEDLADGIGMQRGIADPVPGADFSKQRPGFSARDRLPGLERTHRAGFHMASARQADLSPLPYLVGLAAANAQPETVRSDGDVFNTQGDQLRAAQRADETEQQQRAVTPAAERIIAERDICPAGDLRGPIIYRSKPTWPIARCGHSV